MKDLKNYIEKNGLSSDFKLKYFGYGEWVEEPDLVLFKYKNLKCQIERYITCEKDIAVKPFAHLLGFVQIPLEYPYSDEHLYLNIDSNVHYGITFLGNIENERYVGFDCAHLTDYIPSSTNFIPSNIECNIFTKSNKKAYKNVKFCIEQCKILANELLEQCNKVTTHEK